MNGKLSACWRVLVVAPTARRFPKTGESSSCVSLTRAARCANVLRAHVLFSLKEGYDHLEPLGAQRLRLVSCLDSSRWSIHFEPLPGEDILAAFREWVGKVVRQQGEASGPGSGTWSALIGAARLLTGDLAGADLIVENLPMQPHVLDHGAGYCLVLPMQLLLTAVPLPAPGLQNISRWLAGSAEQAELRTWLRQHHDRLVWDEPRGVYTLSPVSAGTPDIDSDEIRDALARLSRLERIDQIPILPGLPTSREAEAAEILTRTGPAIVPRLEAALESATGTGRIAITQVVMDLDPRRARAILSDLIHDETPAVVNTCLVGFRTVKDWACNMAGNLALPGIEPIQVPVAPPRRRRLSAAQRWLITALVIVALWSYLKWWVR
jgi:hypothetical protein